MKKLEVVLYNIRSMYNVGSIFRTADAVGCSKIYLCGITPQPVDEFGNLRPQMAKVSLGAENTVEWARPNSFLQKTSFREKISSPTSGLRATLSLLKKLKSEGYKILSVELAKNSIPYNKIPKHLKKNKIVLIMGDEVNGLPKSILKMSDAILEIPMRGKKESLNVSVAFGIVAYESVK